MELLGYEFKKTADILEDQVKGFYIQEWKSVSPILYENADIKGLIDAFGETVKPLRVNSITIDPSERVIGSLIYAFHLGINVRVMKDDDDQTLDDEQRGIKDAVNWEKHQIPRHQTAYYLMTVENTTGTINSLTKASLTNESEDTMKTIITAIAIIVATITTANAY